jgi:hypothetical protein
MHECGKNEEQKLPPALISMRDLGTEVDLLHEEAGALRARLEGVMVPPEPEPAPEGHTSGGCDLTEHIHHPPQSPMEERLARQRSKVGAARRILQDVLNRLRV